MKLEIPRPLKAEHDELHTELAAAAKAGGRTGEAARAVADVLHPHFLKEEAYALPPLGLLASLAQGRVGCQMADVLEMTDKLERELPTMIAEHKKIVAALKKLVDAANAEKKPEIARLADKLMLHADTEEKVSYPTALLIGHYVRAKLTA